MKRISKLVLAAAIIFAMSLAPAMAGVGTQDSKAPSRVDPSVLAKVEGALLALWKQAAALLGVGGAQKADDLVQKSRVEGVGTQD